MKIVLLVACCLVAGVGWASGGTMTTAEVRAAVEALPEGGVLSLPRGEYHFDTEGAKRVRLAPSNNLTGDKLVVFPIFGKRNVTIDGNGSTFVFHGSTFPFAALRSRGVTLRNFSIRTPFSVCAAFSLVAADETGFTIRFGKGVCPYEMKDGELVFKLEDRLLTTATGRMSLHALNRFRVHYLLTAAGETHENLDKLPSSYSAVVPEVLPDGAVRFRYRPGSHPKMSRLPYAPGETLTINLEERRWRDAFFFEDCDGVRVENVTISRFGGMGFVAQRSGNLTYSGVRILPLPGDPVALTADMMQFIACYGKVTVEHCEGAHTMDDVINIHGNYLRVESAAGDGLRLRAMHKSHEGFFPLRPGDDIEFVEMPSRKVVGRARLATVTPDPKDAYLVAATVERPLPRLGANVLVENVTLHPDVVFRKNHFHDYPNLRFSGRGKYLIEDNRLEHAMSALLVQDLADYWYESGRVADMTIRNNRFIDCNALGGSAFVQIGVAGWGADAPKMHGCIVMENNRFEKVRRDRWRVAGVREFVNRNELTPPPEARLEPGFDRLGRLAPRVAPDPKDDQWMIGCEVLDRDFAKFSAYKDYLPILGIRSIRLQGGWAKCEREKGRYDFGWLDEPVDFALAHGLNPVLETGYGNPLYKGGGGRDLAAGFPSGEEGLAAWDRWVDALSRHFKGRVRDWAMWNEPDIGNPSDTAAVGGHHTPANIAAFNVRTAKIIRRNIPDARIAGLSLATNDPKFNEDCYKAFGSDIGLFWRFIYHGYVPAPESSYANVNTLKGLCAKYAPKATLWQGENGAPSEMPGDGLALNHIAWSEISQAKWDLRRMLGDFVHGVPSSVFTISDYFHPGRGIGSYGLLRADANRDVIAVKRAFHAVRNVATVFDSNVTRTPRRVSSPERTLWLYEFARKGRPLFVFWTCGGYEQTATGWEMRYARPTDGFGLHPAVVEHPGGPLEEPVWVDLMTGAVFAFPQANVLRRAGGTTYVNVPTYDSPCVLTERKALELTGLGDGDEEEKR